MLQLGKLIAAHPVKRAPYDKLEFVENDQNGTPLYRVIGSKELAGAYQALGTAFSIYGGRCFYCSIKFKPQPLSNDAMSAHRDHVVPTSQGGSDLLHNLVIACGKCGRTKANDPIHDFRPRSAKDYLDALNKHIEGCVQRATRA